jgi:endonuclease/exonuclease/phosphatase family metal-dependent hydrolase
VIWLAALLTAAVVCAATGARFRTGRSAAEIGFVALLPWWITLSIVVGLAMLAAGCWLPGSIDLAVAIGASALRISWPRAARHQRLPDSDLKGMRLLTGNLSDSVEDISPLAREIVQADADIVLVQELTPRHLEALERCATFDGFPWQLVGARPGPTGAGLWSRLEVLSSEWWTLQGRAQVRCVVVQPCGHTAELVGVHVPAPVHGRAALWASSLDDLAAHARRRLAAGAAALVVAGDFNATSDHRPFRMVARAGLLDAAVLRHQAWRMTWPNRVGWGLPRVLRLDHVLVSHLGVAAYRTGRGLPSDHTPLVVTLTCANCARGGQPPARSEVTAKAPDTESEAP